MSEEQAFLKRISSRDSIHRKSPNPVKTIDESKNTPNHSEDRRPSIENDNSLKDSSSEFSEDECDVSQYTPKSVSSQSISQCTPESKGTYKHKKVTNQTYTKHNKYNGLNSNENNVSKQSNPQPIQGSDNKFIYLISFLFLIILSVWHIHKFQDNATTKTTINALKIEFPSQKESVWENLYVAVNNVKEFNNPSVLLFIYKSTDEDYINNFIRSVSNYASQNINAEFNEPINVPISELTSDEAKNDYGYIIEKYRAELNEKAVMVVKHMEEIPGSVAQAFHSLCDEISPLIEKSIFILTVKVDGDGRTEYQKAENTLRKKWTDLDDDIFDPLFTRLSGAVIDIEK